MTLEIIKKIATNHLQRIYFEAPEYYILAVSEAVLLIVSGDEPRVMPACRIAVSKHPEVVNAWEIRPPVLEVWKIIARKETIDL